MSGRKQISSWMLKQGQGKLIKPDCRSFTQPKRGCELNRKEDKSFFFQIVLIDPLVATALNKGINYGLH